MPSRTSRIVLAAAGLLALAPAHASAKPIDMKPQLREGQTMIYQMVMRLGVSQSTDNAQAMESSITSSATIEITIAEVKKDGTARADMRVKQVDLTGKMNGQETGYSWPMNVELGENAPAMAHLGEVLSNETIKLYVSPSGAVGVTGGLDNFVEAAEEIAGTDSRLLGFFSPDTLGTTLTPLFSVDGANRRSRNAGDKWTNTEIVPLTPIGLMNVSSSFKFDSFKNATASYSGQTTFEFQPNKKRRRSLAAIEIVNQSGRIIGHFDTALGIMHDRTSNTRIQTRWVLGDISMEQTQDSTTAFMLVTAE